MREALGPTALANLIRMIRSESPNPILVVEGEDDKFVVEPHLDSHVRVLPGNIGKRSIVLVANELSLERLFFLLDKDLDEVIPADGTELPQHVVRSNSHDILMDLVSADSSYLERAVRALTRKASPQREQLPSAQTLIDTSFDLAWCLVPVRIANQRYRFGIKLRDFPYGALSSVSPTWEEVAQTAAFKRSREVSVPDLLEAIELERSAALELGRELVGDHDFFGAVSRVLKEFGADKITREHVETAFLATIDCALVAKAKWAAELDLLMQNQGLRAFDCPHSEHEKAAA